MVTFRFKSIKNNKSINHRFNLINLESFAFIAFLAFKLLSRDEFV